VAAVAGAIGGGGRGAADRRLPLGFFARPTLVVARDLVGRHVIRREGGALLVARIVETEAYCGEDDLACHASRGRTRRNDPLYRRPGTLYVYFTYGMHWLLNVVTERAGFPAAVLVRAAEPVHGTERMRPRRAGRPDCELLRGPANLCRALGVDGGFNGVLARPATTVAGRVGRGGIGGQRQSGPPHLEWARGPDGSTDGVLASRGGDLWFGAGQPLADAAVVATPRIGVDYAGLCRDLPWRFAVTSSRSVSGRRD
jgi:DNA-3-methyladenine glycosylase